MIICDDVAATRLELEGKGAEFEGGVEDMAFGIGTTLRLPGAGDILVYQPKHPKAHLPLRER